MTNFVRLHWGKLALLISLSLTAYGFWAPLTGMSVAYDHAREAADQANRGIQMMLDGKNFDEGATQYVAGQKALTEAQCDYYVHAAEFILKAEQLQLKCAVKVAQ